MSVACYASICLMVAAICKQAHMYCTVQTFVLTDTPYSICAYLTALYIDISTYLHSYDLVYPRPHHGMIAFIAITCGDGYCWILRPVLTGVFIYNTYDIAHHISGIQIVQMHTSVPHGDHPLAETPDMKLVH